MNIIKCTIIRCLVFSDSANIYTQNCVIRDKVIFLHHHLSRSPSEFLHQLGLFYTSSVSTVSTFLHLWDLFFWYHSHFFD